MQQVAPSVNFELKIVDISQYSIPERKKEEQRVTTQVVQDPFDLGRGPVWRLCLLQLSEAEYLLILNMHHIISDGDWSNGLFFKELALLYEAGLKSQKPQLPSLPMQYREYTAWQQQEIDDGIIATQLAYWKQKLAGDLATLQLPIDRPRGTLKSYLGAYQELILPKELSQKLKRLSQQEQVPLFVTLLAAFKALLHRYTNQDDICVGSPVAGRDCPRIQDLIGYFGNPLVLRTDMSGHPSFRTLLSRIHQVLKEASAHSDCSFRTVVEALKPKRDMSLTPLFQVLFVFRDAPQWDSPQAVLPTFELPDLTITPVDIESGVVPYDLCLFIKETEQGLVWRWEYNRSLFEEKTIQQMLMNCQNLLSSIVAKPEQPLTALSLLSEGDHHRILTEWNQTQLEFPLCSVHQLFAEQVAQTPDAVAVVSPPQTAPMLGETKHLTYQELNRKANQLAHYLQACHMPEATDASALVGLCVGRDLSMPVGVLGILKAGAAYVPLDPTYPKERLEFMLENSGVRVLLTTQKLLADFPDLVQVTSGIQLIFLDAEWDVISSYPDRNPQMETELDRLAYVIHTSGSTGQPKGVAMPHHALSNLLCWQRGNIVGSTAAKTLQFAPVSFDVSFQDMFSTWCTGGTLFLVTEETRRDPEALLDFLCDRKIDRLFLPFVALQQLAEIALHSPTPTSLREVITAGEQLRITPSIADFFKRLPNCTLQNQYGPTESHVVTAFTLRGSVDSWATLPPIGRPIANAQTYILDKYLKPVPVGVPGELYLGGVCLAEGYINRPELTQERFIPNPFAPGRLYQTGDLARYLPDGNIQCLGRADDQVKIRGFRVELGEVEVALTQCPQVREAVVLAKEDNDNKQLIAYIVPGDPLHLDESGESPGDRENTDFKTDQVAHWEQVWDATYSQPSLAQDPMLNLLGWRDSYSEQPIPKPQMQEWADVTVERILNEQPKRVLELGCGTGMLLFRIAPHCLSYVGTDISQQALQLIEPHLHRVNSDVRLYHRAADDFEGLEAEEFDAIVINSVVELFPSIDYLLDVLKASVQQVTPGGFVFVGDVRNYTLLDAFHASVQAYKASDSLTISQLEQRITHQLNEESQLTVDPDFFLAIKQQLPQISHVQIQLRRGHYHNEMTRFRYDVILHVEKNTPAVYPDQWLDWQKGNFTLPALDRLLTEEQPEVLGIRQVPNARVLADVNLLELLAQDDAPNTVGELHQRLQPVIASTKAQGRQTNSYEPEAFWALGDELPYTIYISESSSGEKGCYDVICQRQDADAGIFSNALNGKIQPWEKYANNPRRGQLRRQLEPQLRSYLGEHLPEYMVPRYFVVLDALPLTPSGKINYRALPVPTVDRPELSTALVIPQTEIEQLIASVWQKVLQLETVGTLDNFFELGGNSLLLTQVYQQLTQQPEAQEYRERLSIVTLFQYPTVQRLAEYLSQSSTVQAAQLVVPEPSGNEPKEQTTDIAIVGLSCRVPGAATVDDFWANLCQGVESITPLTEDELSQLDAAVINHPDYVKVGAALPDIDQFDADFFGYSDREAEIMDPQQRIFLESAWEALESAGYNPENYAGSIGVFVGSGMNTYLINNVHPGINFSPQRTFLGSALDFQIRLANSKASLPARVSYKLNLKGPSVNVQTACSTSLVSIHIACQSILNGECDLALAGSISVSVPQKVGYFYQEGMMYSPDGHCRAFDAQAQGTVFGNGVGVVVLKALDRAMAEGDYIYAVIKGSAVNNDGADKVGYTAPSVEGQAAVITRALAAGNVDSATVSYVEAHGTGTSLGDPIEIAALTQAFRQSTSSIGFCAIGSVKTNVGHLIEAAGVVGLIKTALSLKHQQLPPSLHFEQPNPNIDFANSPFYVNTELSEWPRNESSRRAGVSSFGMGGINCHVVLEEAPAVSPQAPADRDYSHHLLTLSAKTKPALRDLVQRYIDYLASEATPSIADICFTANVGRHHFKHRLAIVAESKADITQQLQQWMETEGLKAKTTPTSGKIAFLFTGQGAQYVDMGKQLYETHPTFRTILNRCDEILKPYLEQPLLQVLYPQTSQNSESASLLDRTQWTQPVLFAIEYALYQLWASWGVEPDLVMGHSVGEYVAACVAGVFSLEDGLKLIAARGRLMQAMPANGGMLSLLATEAQVREVIQDYPGVSIAAFNGPESIVISGEKTALEAIRVRLDGEGIKNKQLQVSHGFHSALMEPMLAEFKQVAEQVHFSSPKVLLVSNVTGKVVTEAVTQADYWCRHMRQAVQFKAGMDTLTEHNVQVFVEIGPKPILLGMGRHCLSDRQGLWLPSLHPKQDDGAQLLTSLAALYAQGLPINWPGFYQGRERCRHPLPTYPFQRQRHWIEPPTWYLKGELSAQNAENKQTASVSADETDEGFGQWRYEVEWQPKPIDSDHPHLRNWLIFADSEGLGLPLVKALQSQGAQCVLVCRGDAFEQVNDRVYTLDPGQVEHFERLFAAVPECQGVVNLWSLETPTAETVLSARDLEDAAQLSCGSTLHLIQGLIRRDRPLPRLWLITQGAQAVAEAHGGNNDVRDADSASGSPSVPGLAQSPLWGMGKVITLEHPDLHCVRVDLSPKEPAPLLISALLKELAAQDCEDQVAWREQTRYVARLNRQPVPQSASLSQQQFTCHADGTYLITGGFGSLGLLMAEWLVTQGAEHLILLGRSQPKSTAREQLERLKKSSANVTIAQADVADAQQIKQLLETLQSSGIPPLRGIIHAAGVVDFGGLWQLDWQRFTQVLLAKVQGTWNLHQLTQQQPLDFFVCFSSLAALLGSHGLASYAAANSFMDTLAYHRRALGLPMLSINWGPWSEIGMGARLSQGQRERLTHWGLENIAPPLGLSILDQLLLERAPQIGVMPINWSKWIQQFPQRPPFYEKLASVSSVQRVTPDFRTTLQTAPVDRRRPLLMAHVCQLVTKSLGLKNANALDLDRRFADWGLDSLGAVELRNDLQASCGCTLRTTLLFDYPTITTLVDRLMSLLVSEENTLGLDADVSNSKADPSPSFPSTLVSIQPHGKQRPFFMVSGILGTILDLQPLAQSLGAAQPFYGLRALGLDEDIAPYSSIEAIAAHHIRSLKAIQARGPYRLGGYSFGGKVAFEMAQQLQAQNEDVSRLVLIDIQRDIPEIEQTQWSNAQYAAEFAQFYQGLLDKPLSPVGEADMPLKALWRSLQDAGHNMSRIDLERAFAVYKANAQASAKYQPQRLKKTSMTLFRAEQLGRLGRYLPGTNETLEDPTWGWQQLVEDLTVLVVQGDHFTLLKAPNVGNLAQKLSAILARPV